MIKLPKKTACIIIVSFFFPILSTGTLFAAGLSGWPDADPQKALDGHAAFQYRLKQDETGTFHRFYQNLDIYWLPWGNDSGLVFSGSAYENPGKTDNRSGSVWDTYGDVHGFVHEAFFRWNGLVSGLDTALGRQYLAHDLPVHIDGLFSRYRFLEDKGMVYLLGGYSADPYGVVNGSDSRQAGAGASYRIFSSTSARLEYLGTWEEDLSGTDATYSQGALSFRQYRDFIQWGIAVRSLDSEVESARISGSFPDSLGADSEIDVSYLRQFIDVEQIPTAQSPFLSLLGPIKAYHRITLYLSKQLTRHAYGLSGGLDLRLLNSKSAESNYNHSYLHVYAACDRYDLILPHLRLTIQADYWQNMDAGADQKSIFTGGGEVGYDLQTNMNWKAGAVYALFSYDYYTDLNEKTGVYTIYTTLAYRFDKMFWVGGDYELQIYDQREHRLTITMDVDF